MWGALGTVSERKRQQWVPGPYTTMTSSASWVAGASTVHASTSSTAGAGAGVVGGKVMTVELCGAGTVVVGSTEGTAAVVEAGGVVDNYMGDGALAYFGIGDTSARPAALPALITRPCMRVVDSMLYSPR